MNQLQQVDKAKQYIMTAQVPFEELARIHGAVNFQAEMSFALEAMRNGSSGEYLANIALANVDALKFAIVNVAAIGLTLNPSLKLAYLIVRNKKVMLDISYRGLMKLAIDAGAVQWVQAEVICEKDVFKKNAVNEPPTHQYDPLKPRGEMTGAYCVARTMGGDYLTTVMSADEIADVRARSEAYKKNSGPWVTDSFEMVKKTVIRRASKTWPTAPSDKRFDRAIDVVNQEEPAADGPKPEQKALPPSRMQEHLRVQREMLAVLNRPEEKYVKYLNGINGRKIDRLEDLTDTEAVTSITFLGELVDKQNEKVIKSENVG